MSQPSVTITELDGALGVLPQSGGKLHALVGPSSAGLTNTPAAFAKARDIIANYTSGPLVEAATHYVERYQRPVIVVRTGNTVAGAAAALVNTVSGTSVITLGASTPVDDAELVWRAATGGTIGTAGITYQWSADGGRNWSAVSALGTATTFTFPGSGVTINFAAGTIVAGDKTTTRTTAPNWNAAELGTALDALMTSSLPWEILQVVGPIDATAFDTIELKIAALAAAGKPRTWVGNTRVPNAGESEAAYRTALQAIFASKATVYGSLCAGACRLISSVSGRQYRRPVSYVVGAREAASSEEVNNADVNLGPLVGVSIRDANGNPDEHDESLYPGLDDDRFTVLRTIEDYAGVYLNRPRIFSPAGSDFRLVPHRRVLNVANLALRAYMTRRLNRPILVDAATGYILEEEALEIEAGARAVLRAVLLAKPKASGATFALSRTDNLLSTFTLTGDARVLPLAYAEWINLTLGFTNPALQVQKV